MNDALRSRLSHSYTEFPGGHWIRGGGAFIAECLRYEPGAGRCVPCSEVWSTTDDRDLRDILLDRHGYHFSDEVHMDAAVMQALADGDRKVYLDTLATSLTRTATDTLSR